MTLSTRGRKLLLTAHVTFSVGWLGAVAAFLLLAVVGLRSGQDAQVRAMYVAADMLTRFVIVPASLGALVSGVLQSLGTKWGLLRHHWVLAKLFITVVSTIILFVHARPIRMTADVARDPGASLEPLRETRAQLAGDSAAALVALLLATALSVFKPRGTTAFARRFTSEEP
jgi:hypothetical protein